MKRVCHLTSVHNWTDTRIFYKECISLANAGYDVTLIANTNIREKKHLVNVIGIVNNKNSRMYRATVYCFKILREALRGKWDIYHLHDPELLWVGLILKMTGAEVIFDVHENIVQQIKTKKWLPFNSGVAAVFTLMDYIAAKLFHIVVAETSYLPIYAKHNKNCVVVLNLPDLTLLSHLVPTTEKSNNGILYVGSITFDRGIDVVLEALSILKRQEASFTFYCIGPVSSEIMAQITSLKSYQFVCEHVKFIPSMPVTKAYEYAAQCSVGISILKPLENYKYSFSTKIFEYMYLKLPVLTSNFELYKNVVEKNNCGICIDPTNTEAVAKALHGLLTDRTMNQIMGENGHKVVLRQYSWSTESIKLLNLYQSIS